MIVPTIIKDHGVTLRNVLQALDHNLTVVDNFAAGQGAVIDDADGSLLGATNAINAILDELRRQGIIAS